MIVPSIPFLLFVAVAALIFNFSQARQWRQVVLLAINLLFLASFSHHVSDVLPLAGFLGLGYFAQRVVYSRTQRGVFIGLMVITLTAFFWLKRYSFLPSASFLPFPYLVIGLSYVFFRVLHLIIDSHQRAIKHPVGPVHYLNYTLNFTCLTSGPIQLYEDYQRTVQEQLKLDLVAFGKAIERIVVGYFKVAVVSTLLSLMQRQEIDAISAAQILSDKIWTGMIIIAVYPVYLYFNFSGYTDVVIGVARLFGIVLPENFNRPFATENIIKFWNSWHMTLSNWLKTYVYNPLMIAGMQRITAPALAPYIAVFAFFVTFFLVGAWHGQTAEFLFFGLLQGGSVALCKLYQIQMQEWLGRKAYRTLCDNPLYRAFARGLTFTWFAFTLLWFWSSWADIESRAALMGPAACALMLLALLAVSTVTLAALEGARALILTVKAGGVPVVYSRYTRTAWGTAIVIVTVTLIVVLDSPAPDIVYKTF